MTHMSVDVQRRTLNASGGRTKQLDTFCCVTGFTSDFLSFIVAELIRFFHGAIQLLAIMALYTCSNHCIFTLAEDCVFIGVCLFVC